MAVAKSWWDAIVMACRRHKGFDSSEHYRERLDEYIGTYKLSPEDAARAHEWVDRALISGRFPEIVAMLNPIRPETLQSAHVSVVCKIPKDIRTRVEHGRLLGLYGAKDIDSIFTELAVVDTRLMKKAEKRELVASRFASTKSIQHHGMVYEFLKGVHIPLDA